MKRGMRVWAVLVVGTLMAAGAFGAEAAPESSAGNVGITAKIGTLGFGGELSVGLGEYLGLRLGGNAFAWEGDQDVEDNTIYGDLELQTWSALLDIYPFGGGFRLSGGAMLNDNNIKLRADVSEPVELDDIDFRLSDLHGEVTFSEFAPYVGFGYGNAAGADGHWHFSCDFGVMFQGEPEISASATASNPALQPAVNRALDAEIDDIEDDAKNFKFYPVISVGVSFRF
jgi:hypothetical protein